MDMVPDCEAGVPVRQIHLRVEQTTQERERIVAHKCDLCSDRKGGPACVEVCPASAFVVVEPMKMKKNIQQRRLSAVAEIAELKRN
jgi:electron transport protein HydN